MAPCEQKAGAPPALERRARRAYERGRLLHGLRRGAPLAALVAGVVLASDGAAWRLWVGAAAVLVAAVAFWRGQVAGRAARVGALASLPPLAAPFAAAAVHHGCIGCGGPSLALCLAICTAGGAAAGALVARLAAREAEHDRRRFAAMAVLVAACLGTVGCSFAGAAGLAGMCAGLVAGGAPVMLVARRAR